MQFLQLPADVLVQTLNFCYLEDLQKLDSAYSSESARKLLKECYEMLEIHFVREYESAWIISRNRFIKNISLNKNSNGKRLFATDVVELVNHCSSLAYLSILNYYEEFTTRSLRKLNPPVLQQLKSLTFNLFSSSVVNLLTAIVNLCPVIEQISITSLNQNRDNNIQTDMDLCAYLWNDRPNLHYLSVELYDRLPGQNTPFILYEKKGLNNSNINEMTLSYRIINWCASDTELVRFVGQLTNGIDQLSLRDVDKELSPDFINILASKHPNLTYFSLDCSCYRDNYALRQPIELLLKSIPRLTKLDFKLMNIIQLSDLTGLTSLPVNLTTLDLLFEDSQAVHADAVIKLLELNHNIRSISLYNISSDELHVVSHYVDNCGRELTLNEWW